METYLVLCPSHRDRRELARLARSRARFLFHDYASLALEDLVGTEASFQQELTDPLDEIEGIVSRFVGSELSGVVSTDDYPGSALACAVAERLGLPGPPAAVSLMCQHKYYSRALQKELLGAVPRSALIDVDGPAILPEGFELPAFVKPVKSFFSIGAHPLLSLDQLASLQQRWRRLSAFFVPFERLLERYAGLAVGRRYLMVEGLLRGSQVTLEAYADGGTVHVLGVVDSIMHPGTLAFERFEYPSSLPGTVQERMGEIATALMTGLGYRDGMFNIEFMYDSEQDRVDVIEINPRMASQFADLYEKVDGTNGYSALLELAAGRSPSWLARQGQHRFAASCVLRTFVDMHVEALPSTLEIEDVLARHPDARIEILATVGRRLSDEMQDGHSYRYGVINLGGDDRHDLLRNLQDCLSRLTFGLSPVQTMEPGDRLAHDGQRRAVVPPEPRPSRSGRPG